MGHGDDRRHACGKNANSVKRDATSQGVAGASTDAWDSAMHCAMHYCYDFITETGNSITECTLLLVYLKEVCVRARVRRMGGCACVRVRVRVCARVRVLRSFFMLSNIIISLLGKACEGNGRTKSCAIFQ